MSYLLDLSGPDFLMFYVLAALVALSARRVLRPLLRFPGGIPARTQLAELHPYEIAYLNGGIEAAFKAALAALIQRGTIAVDADEHMLQIRDAGAARALVDQGVYRGIAVKRDEHPLEHEIVRCLEQKGELDYTILREQVESLSQHLERRLVAYELLTSRFGQELRSFLLNVLLPGGVIALGVAKVAVGVSRGRPVTFLFFLILITIVFAWRASRLPRLTRRGAHAIELLRSENTALGATATSAPEQLKSNEVALACALFGGATMGGVLAELARLIRIDELSAAAVAMGKSSRWSRCSAGQGGGCSIGCGGGGGGGGGGCGGCGGGGG